MANSILKSSDLMPKQVKRDERLLHFIFVLLCLLPIVASDFLTTDGFFSTLHLFGYSTKIHNICIFKIVTGYRCPVCGMTRCFTFMTHGDLVSAWHMSHAGVSLYFLCVYEIIYRLMRIIIAKPPFLKVLKIIEIALIIVVCAATAFFFVAQFISPALVA